MTITGSAAVLGSKHVTTFQQTGDIDPMVG